MNDTCTLLEAYKATITMLGVGTDDQYKAKFASPILLFKLSSALFT